MSDPRRHDCTPASGDQGVPVKDSVQDQNSSHTVEVNPIPMICLIASPASVRCESVTQIKIAKKDSLLVGRRVAA